MSQRKVTMKYLVLLLAAVLLSLQCSAHSLEVSAQVDKINLDNNLEPNVIPAPKRRLRKYVTIRQPPPETVQHEAGTVTELECVVMGHPTPSVHWLRNGEPMNDYEVETNDIVPTEPSSIGQVVSKLIITTTASGDVYTCVGTSDLIQKTASTTVYTVEGNSDEEGLLALQKLFRKPLKPIITAYYDLVLQNSGTDIVLPCRVASLTKSQIAWHDNNDNLIYGNPRMRVLPSGALLITAMRWADMGTYSCIAKNADGSDSSETFVYPLKH